MNAPTSGRVLALFDFDGTITTREMLPDFLHYAVPKWRLRFWKPWMLPLVVAARSGWISGSTLRAILAWVAFRDMPETEYEAKAVAFARDVLPGALRPEAMSRIAEHKAQGDTIVVVSGAYDVYLKHWCAQHGLALISSTLEAKGGVMTGRYAGAQCVNSEKSRRVRDRYELARYREIHAYGDTHEDLDLLALAHRKFMRWQEVR